MEIYKCVTFDAGHRVVGHKGKCARLHGHTYKVEIELQSPFLQNPGFVVDFGDIKDLVNEWDHRMLLWIDDPLWGPQDNPTKREQLLGSNGCICLDYNPTVENMANDLVVKFLDLLCVPLDVEDVRARLPEIRARVTLWETPTAYARSHGDGFNYLAKT